MKITLCDTNPDICVAWRDQFHGKGYDEVSIINSPFQDLAAADILVSPGNSFGIMDGGLDFSIRNYLGDHVQTDLQRLIMDFYFGEMPVGNALFLSTGHLKFPFMIYAPTMRIPSRIPASHNAYNAMMATLIRSHMAAKALSTEDKKIDRIVIPGFCGGSGAMAPDEVARQMYAAFYNFQQNIKKQKVCWEDFVNG